MNKLMAITRSVSFNQRSEGMKNNRHEKDKVEPVVGFKVTLYESATGSNTCGEFFISNFNDFIFGGLK